MLRRWLKLLLVIVLNNVIVYGFIFVTCDHLDPAHLGETQILSTAGIVADSYIGNDITKAIQPPFVRILQYQVACEAIGWRRGTQSGATVIVEYECLGSQCPGGGNDTTVTLMEAISIQCLPRRGNRAELVLRGFRDLRTINTNSSCSLGIVPNLQCELCSSSIDCLANFNNTYCAFGNGKSLPCCYINAFSSHVHVPKQ